MANTNNYSALSEKVSKLIISYNDLKERNRELEHRVSGYESDRDETKSKIETIISKIEELEGE